MTFQFGGGNRFSPVQLLIPSPLYKTPFLPQFVDVTLHPAHSLTAVLVDGTGWACDNAVSVNHRTGTVSQKNSQCLSGCTDFYQTMGFKRYTCQQCDFDLCQPCVYAHLKANQHRAEELVEEVDILVLTKVHQHPLYIAAYPKKEKKKEDGHDEESTTTAANNNNSNNKNSNNNNRNSSNSSSSRCKDVGVSYLNGSDSSTSTSSIVQWQCAGSLLAGGCKAGLPALAHSSTAFYDQRYKCSNKSCHFELCKYCAMFYSSRGGP